MDATRRADEREIRPRQDSGPGSETTSRSSGKGYAVELLVTDAHRPGLGHHAEIR